MKNINNNVETLNGMPFIATHDEEGHLRICKNCLYGTDDRHPSRNTMVYVGCSQEQTKNFLA